MALTPSQLIAAAAGNSYGQSRDLGKITHLSLQDRGLTTLVRASGASHGQRCFLPRPFLSLRLGAQRMKRLMMPPLSPLRLVHAHIIHRLESVPLQA